MFHWRQSAASENPLYYNAINSILCVRCLSFNTPHLLYPKYKTKVKSNANLAPTPGLQDISRRRRLIVNLVSQTIFSQNNNVLRTSNIKFQNSTKANNHLLGFKGLGPSPQYDNSTYCYMISEDRLMVFQVCLKTISGMSTRFCLLLSSCPLREASFFLCLAIKKGFNLS